MTTVLPQQRKMIGAAVRTPSAAPAVVRTARPIPQQTTAMNRTPPTVPAITKKKRSVFRMFLPCLTALVVVGLTLTLAANAQVGREAQQVASGGKIDDKAIKEAEQAQKAVQDREERLVAVLKEIEEAVRDMDPGNFVKERRALDGFKKVIPLLKERSAWLLDKQAEYSKNMEVYKAALEKTPAAFRRASDVYARFAAAEDDLFFKEQYIDMANRSQKLATAMEVRSKAVEVAQGEVAQKLRFVERSVVYLNRLEEFLAIYDPAAGKSAEVDSYLKQLDSYIGHFHQSINTFRQLSEKIQGSRKNNSAQRQ